MLRDQLKEVLGQLSQTEYRTTDRPGNLVSVSKKQG